jgi:hypothetical protein
MGKYEKTVQVKVRKVVDIEAYPMGTLAILEDGDKVTLTGENVRRGAFPQVGGYYVEEGHLDFFLSEESLNKIYHPAKSAATV